jgi:FKBP-type peptidyl-prolyl cis-trans isomerase FkpA
VKFAVAAAFVAASVLGCASAQTTAPAQPAKADCKPPPTELVVKEVAPGKGDAAAFKSGILVSYTGWLYDGCAKDFKGEQFDTSQGRVTPFGFVLGAGKVIKGWDEGLMGMKVGAKRVLIIPPDKAYGERSVGGGKIPAGSTLVFDVELMGIPVPPPPPEGSAPKK